MLDDSYERVRRPPEGKGLGPVGSLVFKTRLFFGEVALAHDANVNGPVSDEQREAIKDVLVGNLVLAFGLSLIPEEANNYRNAQELINATSPLGIRISPGKIHQPEA